VLGLVEWGRLDYGESLDRMRAMRSARHRGEIPDTLILVEHPPVITVGVEGSGGEKLPSDLMIYTVERGGKSTYHGPGQLVGYPIVDLDRRGRDVRRFVHAVEEMVVRAVLEFGIHAVRVPGRRGVWVDGERKIASVGIAIEEWVTFHGFALNVGTDLSQFRSFHPCGFDGSVMTSVTEEVGRSVDVTALRAPVIRAWESVFGDLIARASASPVHDPVPAGPGE
jgi:lipoate-protein ligase B